MERGHLLVKCPGRARFLLTPEPQHERLGVDYPRSRVPTNNYRIKAVFVTTCTLRLTMLFVVLCLVTYGVGSRFHGDRSKPYGLCT